MDSGNEHNSHPEGFTSLKRTPTDLFENRNFKFQIVFNFYDSSAIFHLKTRANTKHIVKLNFKIENYVIRSEAHPAHFSLRRATANATSEMGAMTKFGLTKVTIFDEESILDEHFYDFARKYLILDENLNLVISDT